MKTSHADRAGGCKSLTCFFEPAGTPPTPHHVPSGNHHLSGILLELRMKLSISDNPHGFKPVSEASR